MSRSKVRREPLLSPQLRVPESWNVTIEPRLEIKSDETRNEQNITWVLTTRKSERFKAEFIRAVAKAINPFVASRMYFPFCDDVFMQTVMEKLELIAFFMDDIFEQVSNTDNEGFAAYMSCWSRTLAEQLELISSRDHVELNLYQIKHENCPWYCESVTAWFLAILWEITHYMRGRLVPRQAIKSWCDRWSKSHLRYLRGCKAEGEFPDHTLDNFDRLRDTTGIVTYCLLPAEAIIGPLPEEVLSNDVLMESIDRLYYAFEESIGYFNDLISFTKEDQQAVRVKNIVAVWSKQTSAIAEAVEKSTALHDQCIDRAHAEIQLVRELWSSEHLDVTQFIDAICQCAIGCDIWHHLAPRYRNSVISPKLVKM